MHSTSSVDHDMACSEGDRPWPQCCCSFSEFWQSSFIPRHLYIWQQLFLFQVLSELFASWCHIKSPVTSMRKNQATIPNLTHLLLIHTCDHVTPTKHRTPVKENCYLGTIWTFSLVGVLTFAASSLNFNGCVFNYFEGA